MILQVKITPNASTNSIIGWQGEILKVRIAAPPDKNKANEMLIEFFSQILEIPKSKIEILSGHTSHFKRLQIEIDEKTLLTKLTQ